MDDLIKWLKQPGPIRVHDLPPGMAAIVIGSCVDCVHPIGNHISGRCDACPCERNAASMAAVVRE